MSIYILHSARFYSTLGAMKYVQKTSSPSSSCVFFVGRYSIIAIFLFSNLSFRSFFFFISSSISHFKANFCSGRISVRLGKCVLISLTEPSQTSFETYATETENFGFGYAL